MPLSNHYQLGPILTDGISLTGSTGIPRGAVWGVGGCDSVSLYFQPFTATGSAAWPTNLVMEIRCGMSPETLAAWPGGAITLNSTTVTALPYLSQELRVFALPFVGFYITTVASAAWSGIFGIYGEGA